MQACSGRQVHGAVSMRLARRVSASVQVTACRRPPRSPRRPSSTPFCHPRSSTLKAWTAARLAAATAVMTTILRLRWRRWRRGCEQPAPTRHYTAAQDPLGHAASIPAASNLTPPGTIRRLHPSHQCPGASRLYAATSLIPPCATPPLCLPASLLFPLLHCHRGSCEPALYTRSCPARTPQGPSRSRTALCVTVHSH